ncbi:SpoIID/LytB domain-containing protein [bacterium]|nr:SpoIID/LytB domain-containing protein [bacterium]
MKRLSFLIPVFVLWLSRCAVVPPPPEARPAGPVIRVGLVKGQNAIVFVPTEAYELRAGDGRFIVKGDSGERWVAAVRTSRPGRIVYRLVAGSMSTRDRARQKARDVETAGHETEIRIPGGETLPQAGWPGAGRLYRIYLKKTFLSEAEAKAFRDSVRHRFETFVVREVQEPPSGCISLQNETRNWVFETEDAFFVSGSPVRMPAVPVGSGYHWERNEDRVYPQTFSVVLDTDGKLAAVNRVPVETYLEGVVPSEMSPGFPEEALKAQAVAARSKVLANFGLLHPADPYDVCADVHCQVYSGMGRRAPAASRAVRRTAGLVLWGDGRILDAVYGASCGGHTDDVEKVWLTGPKAHLQGVRDGSKSLASYEPLDVESNVRRWILADPPANCNTTRGHLPRFLEYTAKYFRWENRISQDVLRTQVEKTLGRSIGTVRELIPVRRGESGRIVKLKIAGSEGEAVIEGELSVRRALSPTALWSSCFIVETEKDSSGAPAAFTFRGAGWGHGIGMCQTGAAVLALKGKGFKRILKQYYRGAEIRKVY